MKTKKTNLSMERLNVNEALNINGGESISAVNKRTKIKDIRKKKNKTL